MQKIFIIKTSPEVNDLMLSSVEVKNSAVPSEIIKAALKEENPEDYDKRGFTYGIELTHKNIKDKKVLIMNEGQFDLYIHKVL